MNYSVVIIILVIASKRSCMLQNYEDLVINGQIMHDLLTYGKVHVGEFFSMFQD